MGRTNNDQIPSANCDSALTRSPCWIHRERPVHELNGAFRLDRRHHAVSSAKKLCGVLLYRCGGGPAQEFDERSAWKPSAEETRHVELSAQSGFVPGEQGTQEIPANPVPRTSTERRELLDPPEPAKSISLSKCPVFPSSVISFNFFMWSRVVTPVEEAKKTISDTYCSNRATNPCSNEYTSARTTENGSAKG